MGFLVKNKIYLSSLIVRELLIISIVVNFVSCFSKEIIIDKWGDPKFRNYIKWELEITSERENDLIIPSFNLLLRKKTDDLIKYYKFRTLYYYGQDCNFSDNFFYDWTENTPELIELNEKGFILIRRILPAMKREDLIKMENKFLYTEPDGENLEGRQFKMIIVPKS